MAYEYERDEWRSALRSTTDRDHSIAYHQSRAAMGILGDISDAYDDIDIDDDGGDAA